MQEQKGTAFHLTQIGLQKQIPTLRKNLKYEILKSLGPNDFLSIKKNFEYYGKDGVTVGQFVCIMLEVLYQSQDYDKYAHEILTLLELFIYIDYQDKKVIKFEQFTNFVIQNEGIFSTEQNLDDFRLGPAKAFKDFQIVGEKVFTLSGYQGFGVLDQSQKSLQIVDPKSFKITQNISMGGTLITNVYFIKQYNAFVISTNDKNLNFYDLQDNKLMRRFVLSDAQVFLAISETKNTLYSGSSSGKIFEWSLKKIFSDFKSTSPLVDQYKDFLYKGHKNIQCQEDITYLLIIQSIEMIITGSNDSFIRLYEIRESGLNLSKQLEGHYKGIKCLTYSQANKVIVSCSFDFDVLVWNAYLDHPVAKLMGHEAPLNSVYCPQRHSIIISLDSKGIMKIWNCKTFQLMQNLINSQVFIRTSITFSYKQEQDVAILCMKKLLFYEFTVSYDPKITDDKQIVAFKYSHINLQIYIGTSRNFKVWSAEKGVISRIFKNIIENDIIAIQLDQNHRRAFLGSVTGIVISIDVFTGIILNTFAQHLKEISYIGYSYKNSLLITGGWDKTIKIHNDTTHLEKIDKRNNVLRNIKNCHQKDVILASYSDHLYLIATSSRDPAIRLWDFEKGYYECEFLINEQVSCIHFLNPFPLLAISDIKGNMYIFICKYHKKFGKVLVSWKNMYSIQKQSQVTYISSSYNDKELTLILGDEYGYVRLIKLNNILEAENIVPIKQENLGNKNPFRIQDYIFTGNESSTTSFHCHEGNVLLSQKMIKQSLQIKAHNDRINNVSLIRQTDELCILSVGNDHLVKLWNDKGVCLGSLKQGLSINDNWKFIKKHGYETKQQSLYKKIIKELPQIRQKFLNKKRAKMIPFSASNQQDYTKFQHLDSNEIYKDLREIEDYLRKNNPKTQKRLY